MKTHMDGRGLDVRAMLAVVAFGILFAVPSVGAAGNGGNKGNPGVLPPHASAFGHTYGEWAAMWWQWALGIPPEMNPLFDDTGANCDFGQTGHVWFLAGTFNGGAATRACTLPAGKALFFPILNGIWVTTCKGEPTTKDEIRPLIGLSATTPVDLHCSVDGVPLANLGDYFVESPLFCTPMRLVGVETVDDLVGFCGNDPDLVPEVGCQEPGNPDEFFGPHEGIGPSMTTGYYVMLAPLSVGEHTIHFASESPFELDVLYHITVVPARR